MIQTADAVVIGGGVVGAAIAYGLARHDTRVTVLDEGDVAIRSSRVNFGLVWLLGKGDGMPAYGFWTRRSADLWPQFANRLKEETGVDTHYVKSGGLSYCLGEAELETRTEAIRRMRTQAERDPYEARMLDRSELVQMMPRVKFGPDVLGASYGPHDGHVSPLNLLHALHIGLKYRGVDYRPASPALEVTPVHGGFEVRTPQTRISTPKLVLAAGHGITPLARPLGFDVEILAERGQILVTERAAPIALLPANGVRQTAEGTFLIGTTNEDVGYDVSTTPPAGAAMARRAIRVVPALAQLRVVRAWAGLRTLTKDECPVYEQSARYPGAFLATCHSGVTLAAVHANDLAEAIHEGSLGDDLAPFHSRRFHGH
ncbi:MAG: FAD-binding oxidoreductase [Betaproteobacteria bacterium]|nr:MAG: FAD-binding oxidoreductase [Betaproteobacteria bacterium]